MTAIPGNGERPAGYMIRYLVFNLSPDAQHRVRPEFKRRHRHMVELRCARRRHLLGVAVRFPQWGTWVIVHHSTIVRARQTRYTEPTLGWNETAWLDGGHNFQRCGCDCGQWTVDLAWLGAQQGVVLTSELPAVGTA